MAPGDPGQSKRDVPVRYDRLIEYDDKLTAPPMLAESWLRQTPTCATARRTRFRSKRFAPYIGRQDARTQVASRVLCYVVKSQGKTILLDADAALPRQRFGGLA